MTNQYRTITGQAEIDSQSPEDVLHRAACGDFELEWWLPGGALVQRVTGSRRQRVRSGDGRKNSSPTWTKWTEVPDSLIELSGEDARFRLDMDVCPLLAAWLESGCAVRSHLETEHDLRAATRFRHRTDSEWVWQMVPNGDEHSYRRLPRISELRIVVRDQIRPAAHEKKLSDAQEDEILRRSEAGMSRSQLATEFKVSRRPIKNAIESAKARRGSTLAVVTTTWPRASQGIAPKPARKPRRS